MSHLRSLGKSVRARRSALVWVLCLMLGLIWGLLQDGAEAAGQKGKPSSSKCNHLTAAAVFRDADTDGIKSDGQSIYYEGSNGSFYGSPSEYHGWEDSTVCLMMFDDYDFIMGTSGTSFEKTGINRLAVLNFAANPNPPVPFDPFQLVEVNIRSDYVYDIEADQGPFNKRLIVWFTANRVDYKLYFDDTDDETDMVQVTLTGTTPNRVWTIESSGQGRLVGPRKTGIVGYFYVPFKITIYETNYPNTCF